MCPHTCVNHISNGWIMVKFFSSNIIIGESIRISIWELNKVHDMDLQFMGDKKDKWVV